MSGVPLEVWAGLPVAAAGGFGLLAPLLTARMRPRTATWLLSVGSLTLAASTMVVLGLVVVSVAGTLPAIGWLGHYSASRLAAREPFDPRTAAGAGAVLAGVTGLAGYVLLRRGRRLLAAWVTAWRCGTPLVVLPDPGLQAFAVPGWPGRIVTTRGLLQACPPGERRAVFAHEQAHLDGRHDLHLTAVALAAAVNPLLCPTLRAARFATERWADEAAATATGDRRTVAEAVLRVAAGAPRPASGLLTLALGSDSAERRVRRLLAAPPRATPASTAVLGMLAAAAPISALVAGHGVMALFRAAAN